MVAFSLFSSRFPQGLSPLIKRSLSILHNQAMQIEKDAITDPYDLPQECVADVYLLGELGARALHLAMYADKNTIA